MANTFVWYDLMTTDPKAAQAFYGEVVGWTFRDAGPAGVDYTVIEAGEGIGGMMTLPDDVRSTGVPPHWIGYVAVADVDEAAERLKTAGGKVHKAPADIPGVGRFAVVSDPHGAAFILFWGNSTPPPPAAPGTPGQVAWRELFAGDLDEAFDFYAGMFGWTRGESVPTPMGPYQLFDVDGVNAGGMMTKPDMIPVPHWGFYFQVGDIDEAAGKIGSSGGKVLMGPMQVPGGGWIVQAQDPQGGHFAVIGSKA